MNEQEQYDKDVEAKLLSMMEENPAKLLSYFLNIMGFEMVAANAATIKLSQEMTIKGDRYEIKTISKIKKIKK